MVLCGFEPGSPTQETFYKCKITAEPYFHLHSGLFLFKMVHLGQGIKKQAQTLAQNVRTKLIHIIFQSESSPILPLACRANQVNFYSMINDFF